MRIADRLKLVSQNDQPPMSLAIEDTVYRAEGNANIVIALPQVRVNSQHILTYYQPILLLSVYAAGNILQTYLRSTETSEFKWS